MRKDIILWVDDKEPVPNKYKKCTYLQVYNDIEFKREVNKAIKEGMRIYLDLDGDLGAGSADGEELIKWIIANHINIQKYRVHAKNPFTKKRMENTLSVAGYEKF